jgi:adenosylcobinamide-GDP ribazoletransferase
MPDSIRLAIGTLTRIRVPAPRVVDRRTARNAMLLAPVVGSALALVVGVAVQLLAPRVAASAGPLLLAALAVAVLAYLTRALHLDGLADTADALGSGRPAAQALEIARRSDIGPFGVVTLVLVLLVQVGAYAGLVSVGDATLGLVIAVGTGRLAITLACLRGVPAARPDGLGATVAGSVPGWAFVVVAVCWTGCSAGAAALTGFDPISATVAVLSALVAGAVLVRTSMSRFGGITGDVLGATAEVATTVALVILVVLPT